MLLLIYDVTVPSSLDNISQWIEATKTVRWVDKANERPLFSAIFANKTDLVDRRIISTEKGKEVADHYGMQYFEGSAVNALFCYYNFLKLVKL